MTSSTIRQQDLSTPRLSNISFFLGVLAISLIAAGFRFWDLSTASIWMDEAFTVMAGRLSPTTILFDQIDVHPPAAYLIQHYWMLIFPDLSLTRVPSAVLGIATILVIVASTADLSSRPAGLWAGLLLAVSTGHIYYSQDARMYPLVLLCLALAQWGLIGTLSKPSARLLNGYVILYVIAALLAIYTHVISIIFLTAINLGGLGILLWQRSYTQMLKQFLTMNGFVLLISTPWILQVLDTTSSFHGIGAETTPKLILFFMRNAVGYAGLPRILDIVTLVTLAVAPLGGVILASRYSKTALASIGLAGLVLFPAILIVVNIMTPILAARMFLPLLLPISCLTGVFLAMVPATSVKWALGISLIAVASFASASEHFGRTKHDDPRAALLAAYANNFGDGPVLTCHFLDAGAVAIAGEQIGRQASELLTYHGGGIFRYDTEFFNAVKMSMAQLRRSSGEEVQKFLGDDHLFTGGLAQALTDQPQVAFISSSCGDARITQITSELQNLGYRLKREQNFQSEGRIVMEKGETKLLEFTRNL